MGTVVRTAIVVGIVKVTGRVTMIEVVEIRTVVTGEPATVDVTVTGKVLTEVVVVVDTDMMLVVFRIVSGTVVVCCVVTVLSMTVEIVVGTRLVTVE